MSVPRPPLKSRRTLQRLQLLRRRARRGGIARATYYSRSWQLLAMRFCTERRLKLTRYRKLASWLHARGYDADARRPERTARTTRPSRLR